MREGEQDRGGRHNMVRTLLIFLEVFQSFWRCKHFLVFSKALARIGFLEWFLQPWGNLLPNCWQQRRIKRWRWSRILAGLISWYPFVSALTQSTPLNTSKQQPRKKTGAKTTKKRPAASSVKTPPAPLPTLALIASGSKPNLLLVLVRV